MLITKVSTATGKINTRAIPITPLQLMEIENRGDTPIQKIAPYLSENDREFFISGMTPKEWEEMFKEREELEGDTHLETYEADDLAYGKD